MSETTVKRKKRISASELRKIRQRTGAMGGRATAEKHGSEFVRARGQKGGQTTIIRYGKDYFKYIRQMGLSKNA